MTHSLLIARDDHADLERLPALAIGSDLRQIVRGVPGSIPGASKRR